MSTLVQQKITVHVRQDVGDPVELELLTANPDLVRWDITRAKHGWPGMEDVPMLWATFVAWTCAKRLGLYSGSWDDWSNRDALSVEFDTGEDGQVPADPTQTGAEHSSASP